MSCHRRKADNSWLILKQKADNSVWLILNIHGRLLCVMDSTDARQITLWVSSYRLEYCVILMISYRQEVDIFISFDLLRQSQIMLWLISLTLSVREPHYANANRLDPVQPPSYSAAGLDPTCLHKHKCGSHTEKVKNVMDSVEARQITRVTDSWKRRGRWFCEGFHDNSLCDDKEVKEITETDFHRGNRGSDTRCLLRSTLLKRVQ